MQKQRAKMLEEKMKRRRDQTLVLPTVRLSRFIASSFIYAYSHSIHDVY
jgi:hypothetical protein